MYKKRGFALLLSIVCFAAGCGAAQGTSVPESVKASGSESETESETVSADNATEENSISDAAYNEEDIEEINWIFWGMSATPTKEALQEVETALNAITIPEIGVKVNMEITDVGTYMSQVGMRIVSGESIDLFTTFVMGSASFGTMLNNGQLMDITDMLAEYAPETMELLPEEMLAAASREGKVYGVPTYTNYVTKNYWVCQKEIFEGAGLDAEQIKTLDDVHKALVKIKEVYPDKIPLGGNSFVFPGGQSYELATGQHVDAVGTPGAAYIQYENEGYETKVVNRYESENFKLLVQTLKAWDEEGLIDRDMAMNASEMWYLNPKIVSSFESQNYMEMASMEQAAGQEYEFVELSSNNISGGQMLMLTSTVPVTAKQPESAVKFLNLLYTNQEVKNLVSFGIEGKHWEFKEDGRIGFPEGVDESNSGYYMGSERLFGNVFLNYVWDNMDGDVMEKEKELMDHAAYSTLLGFSFNSDPVSTEEAQLSAVKDEYFNTLLGGGGDERTYQAFIDKLYASGLELYIGEVQKQLDEWMAAQ